MFPRNLTEFFVAINTCMFAHKRSSKVLDRARFAPVPPELAVTMLCSLALMWASGCGQVDEITSYTVPKPHVVFEENHISDAQSDAGGSAMSGAARDSIAPFAGGAATAGILGDKTPKRMLAAIVPQGDRTWFFKLVGPDEPVVRQDENFLAFITSLKFRTGDSDPEWDLPEGWEQHPGVKMRFATVRIGSGEDRLELSVIPLSTAPGDYDEYVLMNVNRWRRELQLQPISRSKLYSDDGATDETRKIQIEGKTVTLVTLVSRR